MESANKYVWIRPKNVLCLFFRGIAHLGTTSEFLHLMQPFEVLKGELKPIGKRVKGETVGVSLVRVPGFEPGSEAWEAPVLTTRLHPPNGGYGKGNIKLTQGFAWKSN